MIKNTNLFRKGIWGCATSALLLLSQGAGAASVTVRVVDAATLQPVGGVAVCMGSAQSPQAYGAIRTDAEGEAVYLNSPDTDYILSVAGDGQGDYSQQRTPRNFDIIYYVALDSLYQGTQCLAPVLSASQKSGKAALELVSVDVQSHSHTAGTVDVATQVKGVKPTHIRVSTRRDMAGARWMPYRHLTRHSIERVSSSDLFVQVRRIVSHNDSSVEASSSARIADLHWD